MVKPQSNPHSTHKRGGEWQDPTEFTQGSLHPAQLMLVYQPLQHLMMDLKENLRSQKSPYPTTQLNVVTPMTIKVTKLNTSREMIIL